MEETLRGLPLVKIYCDDLLIISRTRAEHFLHLRSVLQRIKRFGIRLAADKCKLFQKHIEFLGYKIDEDGITPEKDKLKIIKDMLAPQTVSHLEVGY